MVLIFYRSVWIKFVICISITLIILADDISIYYNLIVSRELAHWNTFTLCWKNLDSLFHWLNARSRVDANFGWFKITNQFIDRLNRISLSYECSFIILTIKHLLFPNLIKFIYRYVIETVKHLFRIATNLMPIKRLRKCCDCILFLV